MKFIKQNWPILLIIAIAIFLRFYQLGSLPPGLHPDEAANGLDIIRMIEKGDFRVAYDTNGPREALFFYLQGIFVFLGAVTKWAFLNFTPLSLRIAPAIIGVITVWGTYLLSKELFSKNIGLFASAAMAVSAWHIQFSRNGFRAIMVPMCLVFLFYFFIRAYRGGKIKDYICAGVFLALGFYTYLAFRMVPLILGALLLYIFIFNRKFLAKNKKNIMIFAAAFLVAMIPMFIHFIRVPEDILGRASTSIFNKELNGGSPLWTLFENKIKTIAMFNFNGDPNFRHNLGGTPMLDIITGILFWIGAVISLVKIKKIEHFLLLTWFAAMTLPEILTAEGIPHALRLVGVIPVVFIWISLGLEFILSKISEKYIPVVGLTVIILFSGALNFNKYFIEFPKLGDAGDAYAEDMVEISNDLVKAGSGRRNILIVGGYGTKTIDYITHSTLPEKERYEPGEISKIKFDNQKYKIYIAKDWYSEARRELMKKGLVVKFDAVTSKIDGRTLYYEYAR